jgi:glycosyltransferase involved in cell wall biosynthesis
MKILFITNGFPPQRWAGTETYTAGIAKGLQEKGHEIQILCAGKWDDGPNFWNGYQDDLYNDLPVRRINLNWKKSPDPFRYLYQNPVIAQYLTEYLDELRPDVVHVSSCETLSASILSVVKTHRIPLVLSITDFWFLCPQINLLRSDGENCSGVTTPWDCLTCLARDSKVYRYSTQSLPNSVAKIVLTQIGKIPLLARQNGLRGMFGDIADRKHYLRQAFSLPDVRTVASKFVKNVYITNGFDDPTQLQPYGHDLSWLHNYHGKLSQTGINIGFIGQIINSKGVHLLVEAARRLTESFGKKVNFLIYGDTCKNPEYTQKLKVISSGLDNVHFCGTYPHAQSAEVYSKIHVLVVPSLWYDFPLIIHEAFSTQTPVIATRLGGMAEAVLHETNGLLFERGNVDDLTHQIRRIMTEPSLLQKLTNGIQRVKRVEEEVDELEETYQVLLSSRIKS